MKGFNKLAVCISAVILMTACNRDGAVDNENVSVRFSAQIGEQHDELLAQSRASGAEWAAGDRIGVYAFENMTTNVALEMANKEYMADAAGTTSQFTPKDDNDIFFPVNGSERFDFMAYYPYQDGVIDFIYKVNVSDQSKPEKIDLLYANTSDTKAGGHDKTDSNVEFVFYHKLAKFTIETKAGKGLTAADLIGMTVTIKGMNTRAEFDLELAELDNATSPANLTPVTVEDGVLYESIVLPAETFTEGEWSVEFLVNGKTYVWEVPTIVLEEGNEYIWKISVQKIPVLISGRIVDWQMVPDTGDAW